MINHLLSRFFWGILNLVSLLPFSILNAFSKFLYIIGWHVFDYRRSVIIQNLSRSFPQKKYNDISYIANHYSRYLFKLFAEWTKMMTESKESIKNRIRIVNGDLLQQEGDIFLVLGHYGNWENLGTLPLFSDKPMYAVYKEQSSEISNYISCKMRQRFGMGLIESKQAGRFILKNKVPSVYVLIADQSPHSSSKTQVNFMNQPTLAFEGIERLAAGENKHVVYTEILPKEDNKYDITLTAIENKDHIVKSFFEKLEKSILNHPEYWLWSHKRWKHSVKEDK